MATERRRGAHASGTETTKYSLLFFFLTHYIVSSRRVPLSLHCLPQGLGPHSRCSVIICSMDRAQEGKSHLLIPNLIFPTILTWLHETLPESLPWWLFFFPHFVLAIFVLCAVGRFPPSLPWRVQGPSSGMGEGIFGIGLHPPSSSAVSAFHLLDCPSQAGDGQLTVRCGPLHHVTSCFCLHPCV